MKLKIKIFLLLLLSSLAYSQTQMSGSLSTYVIDFLWSPDFPMEDGNDYAHPNSAQKIQWANTINAMLDNDYALANSIANNYGYRIIEFYDETTLATYYILDKQASSTNHWGLFVYNPNAKRSKLFIQSPHPRFDTYTGRQGAYIFRYQDCRALFISGTHRCNSTSNSTCSGTTSVCYSSGTGPYKISDQPHTVDGTLQLTTEILNSNISNLIVIQPHGFAQGTEDPELIISNGTRITPNPDYIAMLRDNLLIVDNTLTFKIAHIDLSWDRLIAFTNTQGRLINNSINPCSNNATQTTGRFIHIEQAYSLRNSTAARKKLSDAIGMTFPGEELALTAPSGSDNLTAWTTYNITWNSTGIIDYVKLEYSVDNGSTWVLIDSEAENNGQYEWVVPNIGTLRGKIRISDAENNAIFDECNSSFKIQYRVYPTTGTTVFVDPASGFGPRLLNGVYDFHRGIDYSGELNSPIYPGNPGVIVRKEDTTQTQGTALQRFGNWILVKIDSPDSEPRHNAYLHLNGFHHFNVGDTVTTADTIGFMGKSGYEINTVHLHFELYKNLSGTAINKDKAKNPLEVLPYDDLNNYEANIISRNDSTAVELPIPDTELDIDEIIIYGSSKTKSIGYNARIGIDPVNNDNPRYNEVFIDPSPFRKDSSKMGIRFWVKDSECGSIDSVRIKDIKGYSFVISKTAIFLDLKVYLQGAYRLEQNYPNPFNPTTRIQYNIPSNVNGKMSKVVLKVFDILGKEIATLVDEEQVPGNYEVQFDAPNLSSGVYFYRLKVDNFVSTKKLTLIK